MSHPDHVAVLRILDAALNRASEGLRVVEDYLRMVLGDAHLSRLAKQLRHDLAATAQAIESNERHTARDTLGDVGTTNTTASEAHRGTAADVAAASFKRTAEALRTLEEYGKLFDGQMASACEALRYRLYTLEKAADLTRNAQARLSGVQLYVLVDAGKTSSDFGRLISSLVKAGVGAIQLRHKQLDDRTLLERAKQLVAATRATPTLAIVNDRADIAVAAATDGVHLGQEDLPLAEVRRIVGSQRLIGVSTHHVDQARQAVLDGADYLGAGPTFSSTTKAFDSFAGLEYLRQVAAEVSLPVFAIGGIDANNLPDVLSTGVSRVAVAGAVTQADDPAAAASLLAKLLTHSSPAAPPSGV